MTDPESSEAEVTPADPAVNSPFGPGIRVALCQYAPEGGGLGRRDLGVGEILVRPQVGQRLELRIRSERGLASSPIRELRLIGERCLGVASRRRVYVLSLLETTLPAPDPFELSSQVEEMFSGQTADGGEAGEVTQYVRIGESLVRPDGSPLAGRDVQIERTGLDDPDAKPERLGTGQLLAEPEPGLGLRFQVSDGQVLTTSVVVTVERCGTDAVEASTANSRYRFELTTERSPGDAA